jgi:pimeloyl-ACP methyl ester carboxylesterase
MQADKELVVLLHGILLNRHVMYLLARRLRRAGFDVLAITYPSRRMPLEGIANFVHEKIAQTTAHYARVHFVGHSMGGLVIRHYISAYPAANTGRVVMLGTPNQGSEWADLLKHFILFRWLYGPAGQQLTTDTIHPAAAEVQTGIIAGNVSHIPCSARVLRGANDGQVSVTRTHLPGMHAHCVLPCSHTALILRTSVAERVGRFLKTVTFD